MLQARAVCPSSTGQLTRQKSGISDDSDDGSSTSSSEDEYFASMSPSDVQGLLHDWGLSSAFGTYFQAMNVNGELLVELTVEDIDLAKCSPTTNSAHVRMLFRKIKRLQKRRKKEKSRKKRRRFKERRGAQATCALVDIPDCPSLKASNQSTQQFATTHTANSVTDAGHSNAAEHTTPTASRRPLCVALQQPRLEHPDPEELRHVDNVGSCGAALPLQAREGFYLRQTPTADAVVNVRASICPLCCWVIR